MSNLPATGKPFLTVYDLANLVGVNPATVRQMDKERRIPGSVRIGRQLRFNRLKVEHWLEQGGEKAAA